MTPLLTVIFIIQWRQCLSGFSAIKFLVVFPFPYLSLWEKVSMVSMHLRNVDLCSISLRIKYVHKLFETIQHRFVYFLHLFIPSFIYTSIYLWIFYVLSYNPILLYFVQFIPALAIGTPFRQLLHSFNTPSSLFGFTFDCLLVVWHYNILQAHLLQSIPQF